MKAIFAFVLCLVCGFATAQTMSFSAPGNSTPTKPTAYPPPAQFENIKSKHLARINARIAALQKEQACVQAAVDFESMRACRQQGR